MSKLTKGLLFTALALSLMWSGLSALYTHSLSEELTTLRRENRSDTVYLRCRIRELESELTADLLNRLTPSEPVGGVGEVMTETVTEGSTTPAEPDKKPADTEAVTLPVHQSPETQAPAETELETAPTLYLVTEQDGMIGLFDASGELLRMANVFVMTLPEADRQALAVGIACYSWEEAVEVLERYE